MGSCRNRSREVICFAYGSNMLTARIRKRVGSVRTIAIGFLTDHRLVWTKPSDDGSGKCGVVPSDDPADIVWGVLQELDELDLPNLDRFEGGYVRRPVIVRGGGGDVHAATYIPDRLDPGLRPYGWYKRLVIAGAEEAGLPAEYIAQLESIPSVEDPDESRRSAELRALATGGDAVPECGFDLSG